MKYYSIFTILLAFAAAVGAWEPFPAVKSRQDFPGIVRFHSAAPEVAAGTEKVADYISRNLTRLSGTAVKNPLVLKLNTALEPEEYILDLRTAHGSISAGSTAGLWNGAALFLDYAGSGKAVFDGKGFTLPALLISDKPGLKYRAIDFQWCYTPPTLELMKRTVRTMRALRMNGIVPEFGPRLMWTSDKSALPHSTAREFLRECVANGLLVIPKINSLGHSDRGFPWPDKLGTGLDLGSERNYAALEAEIAAWKKELTDAGLPFVYFHFGMDEASGCLRKNVKKYKKDGAELVAAHMNRIAALCRKYNITGIIYHDMLIGKNEPIYWREMGTMHADADKSYPARKKIARSLVLNYWNYEGFSRYRTVEGLHDEGFSIFFTPWGGTSVRNMARNAALYGEGIIGSTWCDWHIAKNGTIPPNSIFNRSWIRDGLTDCAVFGWNPYLPPRRPDGGAGWIDRWFDRESRVSKAIPLKIAEGKTACTVLKGVPFRIGTPIQTGRCPVENFEAVVEKHVKSLRWPLTFTSSRSRKKQPLIVKYYNQPEHYREVTLYTRSYGRSTQVGIYSTEVRIHGNVVWSQNDWGVGDTLIPRNGFVLSGFDEKYYGLGEMPVTSCFTVKDADGKAVEIIPAGAIKTLPAKELPLNGKFSKLHLLHRASMEGEFKMAPAVRATLKFTDGTSDTREFCYGRELAAVKDSVLATASGNNVWIAQASGDETLYAYTWKLPQGKECSSLRLEPLSGGYELLAVSGE